jgi:hypothetical protein
MRLTLRTLLAYLDDILEPAQAREIGEKIAESSVATELTGRIRDILRRRRITAPQISGPGSGPDPNLTAEYLDNTLSPQAVAEFEQICLESDVHLAEVAACHQILTLVLGEPADVSPELRQRMHALGAIAPTETETGVPRETVVMTTSAAPEDRSRSAAPSVAGPSRATSFEEGLPPQLRRKSFASRAFWAVILLLGVGWLALLYFDPHLREQPTTPDDQALALAGQVEAVRTDEGEAAVEPSVTEAVEPSVTEPEPQEQDAAEQPTAEQPAAEGTEQAEPATPVVAVAEPEPAATPGPNADAPAVPDAQTANTEPAPPQPQPDAFQEPKPVQPVDMVTTLYNSPDGILLQRNGATDEWTVMPRRALLHAGDEIACPEPFSARLQIDDGACLVLLLGGSRLKLLGANDAGPFGFELDRGRIGVFRTSGEPPADQSVSFGLQMRDRFYSVSLKVPDTWCGFDLVPPQPWGQAAVPQAEVPGGGIFVARGAVHLVDPMAGPVDLQPDNGWRPWAAADAAAQPLLAVPNWLSPGGPPLPAVYRTYANLYEKEFPLDQPVGQSIPAIVRDRRPRLSEFAVETLALTGNYRELSRALKADHEESRLAAIIGLREWLLRDPGNADLLRADLEMMFRDDDAAAVDELLWGYSRDDGRDAATSARLVDWLGSDEVAIRELALFHIKMITGRDNEFHPTAPKPQRDAAVGRWQDFLRRNGSLIPAEE